MAQVIRVLALAGLLASAAISAKKNDTPVDPGPRPSEAEFRVLAERAALQGFFDPGSAQFEWPFGIVGGYFKPVLQGKKVGWWTCGQVNGKNRMGGYVGFRSVVVVVNNGAVVFSAVGDGSTYDFIAGQCQQAVSKGVLSAAPPELTQALPIVAAQGSAPPSTVSPFGFAPQLGFAYESRPAGVVVNAITPGSLAAQMNIPASATVTRVNGIDLAPLEQAMREQLLSAAGEGATLSLGDGSELKMTRQPGAKQTLAHGARTRSRRP